jgi:hypothetical protein
MVDEDESRAKLRLRGPSKSSPTHGAAEPLKPEFMRTLEELAPLAMRIAQNAELMDRFRAVAGSDDKTRAMEMIDEITRYAQSLDQSISFSEGTRVVVALMKIVGHSEGEANG